ncbi:MAG: FHA domain-containing protein [Spirochaetales bacterium]|nr:FHA domain-containing protein [Spirochaetales bacterium]
MDPSWKVCPRCLPPVCGWLVIMSGEYKNEVYTIHEGLTKIGSAKDCDLIVPIKEKEKQGILLRSQRGSYTIKDLGELEEGTYLNGAKITDNAITDSDMIKISDLELLFKCL